ncbi:MAG: heme-copper oxidase subunit III [Chloroflexi bacterium]|nr:heme-copper oxidase subunit III [Chloroflexota bacterium]
MAAHGAAERQGMTNSMLGFILFLASEVMFFGGLFAAYFIARADAPAWPPPLTPEQIAEGVHLELEVLLPAISTGILVLSSVTMQYAVWQIQKGNQGGMLWGLFISLALGIVFLAAQLYDYTQLHFRADDTIYGTTFYTLTGFHGAHVAGGALFIAVVTVRALGGQFTAENHEAVEASSMYWHFVDVVWIALFTVLYIIK